MNGGGKPQKTGGGADQRVLVGLSGGTDSAVAAALLKNQGFDPIAVHLKLWEPEREGELAAAFPESCSVHPAETARKIAAELDIPLHEIDLHDVFMDRVVDNVVHEVLQHREPSPCVRCNRGLKISFLLAAAEKYGCSRVATGHLARIENDPTGGQNRLFRASEAGDDQSYYLFDLQQNELQKMIFPLGGLPKAMLVRLRNELKLGDLAAAGKSHRRCFLDAQTVSAFVESRSAASLRPKGIIRTRDGRVLADHDGMYRYRIGQKIMVPGMMRDESVAYVVGFDAMHEAIIVGSEFELNCDVLTADRASWVRPIDQMRTLLCEARISPRHPPAPCEVTLYANDTVRVRFESQQRAPQPGNAVVFYRGDEVLGGAWIARIGTE